MPMYITFRPNFARLLYLSYLVPRGPQLILPHRGRDGALGDILGHQIAILCKEWMRERKNEADIDKRLRDMSYWEMEGRRGPKNSTLSPGERWPWPLHDPTTHPGGAQVIEGRPAAAIGLEERTAAGPPGPMQWSCMTDYSLCRPMCRLRLVLDYCRFRVKDRQV